MKKTITCLFLSILMLCSTLSNVSATINVPERTSNTTWVEDYAGVLSESTENYIQNYSQVLADEYSACIVVVTVDFVIGSIDDYCLSIFNRWQIGDATLNNGILLLLSIGDDDYYMMIGRGLEDKFPISDIQTLLNRYLEPSFAIGEYDRGVRSVFEQTYQYVVNEIYGNPSGGGGSHTNNTSTDYGISVFQIIIAIALIAVAIILFMAILSSRVSTARYYRPTVYYTRPRYRTYRSPYTYTPSHFNGYDRPSSSSSSSYSGGGSSYSGGGSSSHSSSSHSSGSGRSSGGSSRGAGAGRH